MSEKQTLRDAAKANFAGHTPGPWEANKRPNSGFYEVFANDDDDTPIATVHVRRTVSGDHPNAKANLALIAAAPDLYASLEQMVHYAKPGTGYDSGGRFDVAKWEETVAKSCAALAKARGEQCPS